ncbi:MAG: chlorophyll a/b-binding protein [Leptolyngbyaceae cyanobacterium]
MTTNEESTFQATAPEENPRSEEQAQASAVEPLTQPEPAFGWTAYAEQINGRFAMIGFVLLLILEVVTGQTFFTWLGLG